MSTSTIRASDFILTDSADNGVASVTRTGALVGMTTKISSVSASYSAANIGLLTLKQGETAIAEWFVHNEMNAEYSTPITIASGEDVTLELAASGSGGTVGKVNLVGYTN